MKKTIFTMWKRCGEQYKDLPAVRWLVKKDVHELSYGELAAKTAEIRKGLAALSFDHKHISIIGTSSIEWIKAYMSVVSSSNAAVPLDPALPAEDLIDLVARSDSEGVFLDKKFAALADAIKAGCPKLRHLWMLSEEKEEGAETIADLIEAGKDTPEGEPPAEDDVSMIVFTSGTTGKSKGVMLTQSNLYCNVEAIVYDEPPGVVFLSVLPVHHAFCLSMDWLNGFWMGGIICINDSLMHMVRNMTIFNPHVMLMVPLMLETIYKRVKALGDGVPPEILAKKVFGPNLTRIFTGGAHLEPYYIDEFAKFGIEVYEGYGMSECAPVITSNKAGAWKPGSIGKPLPNVEVKFEDGEICVRGTSVMKGYYNMETETEQTLRDGWLHTGDKGYMDEDGFLFINGRVKNLIILSNGENISPEEIEGKLALKEFVGEVIVTGEDNLLTARIYPDPDTTEGKTAEEIRAALQAILDDYNKDQPTYKQLSRLVVRENPFFKNSSRKIIRTEVLRDEPLA
ncbi:long-chain acyl-CoA synthetase [Ruminococcus sp. YE71]|uniref:AMP-binding protein n=1 Tax=unclassified Ruminococcus TaxID=2608920 RepID=UPI0008885B43|nr:MULTISPECIES: AMP-binding protein [unclassified Ruminococcus]SDA29827.1 long-chain acyl-CoA synthetase [Ruminococcus sp. YE78]SFW48920.1 long-chain acyl-CoA synthetase [Ruminococcus sp. YE71]